MHDQERQKALPSASKTVTLQIPDENFTAVLIDKGLDRLRQSGYCDLVEKNESRLIRIGLYGLYLAALLGLLASVILPMRYPWLTFGNALPAGLIWVLGCLVLHYTAWKFLPRIPAILEATPTHLASAALPDIYALGSGIGGIVVLLGGFIQWIKTSSFLIFLTAFLIFAFLEYMTVLSLRPRLLNIQAGSIRSAGEEFMGIFSFLIKLNLRATPVAFGLVMILGLAFLLELLFSKYDLMEVLLLQLTKSSLTVVYAALLPLFGYLAFLFWHYLVDLGRAILRWLPHGEAPQVLRHEEQRNLAGD